MKNETLKKLTRGTQFLGAMLMTVFMTSAVAFSQPAAPVLVAPVNGLLNVTTSPALSWNAATGTGSITYHLQVSVSLAFGTTLFDNAALTGVSQGISGLANDATYYWHVSAADDGGSGSYSTVDSFRTNPTPVELGTAGDFRILAETGITTTGVTLITGDIGVSAAATTMTGFAEIMDGGGTFSTSSLVTGNIYAFNYASPTPTKMTTAVGDMGTAYTNAANRTPTPVGTFLNAGNGAGEIGGLDIGPGLYKWTTAVTISNDLTLTGNATDVWIFQLAQTLGMASGKQIILVGGALASNVFWQVAGQVSLIGNAAMKGIILGATGIAFGNGATIDGRALAQTNVTLIGNSLLPVELVSFTGAANKKDAVLNWSTSTEVNNFGFEVERAIDNGKLAIDNWSKAGFVEGNGTTNVTNVYSYSDAGLSAGKYAYRLKQIDRDGKFTYSQSVEVTIGQTPNEYVLTQNYPNPFNPSTVIHYSLAQGAQVSLKVYNTLGAEVAELVNGRQEAGNYSVPFTAAAGSQQLTSGVYFYRIQSGSFVDTKKMILMK